MRCIVIRGDAWLVLLSPCNTPRGEGVSLEFGLVSLGLHCFLRMSSAGLIIVLLPGCCWACSAFSVYHI